MFSQMPVMQADYLLGHILQKRFCRRPLSPMLIEEHRWNLAESWSPNTKEEIEHEMPYTKLSSAFILGTHSQPAIGNPLP